MIMLKSEVLLFFQLAAPITPSMVTMEHLNPSLARFIDDAWQSMPKNFSVFVSSVIILWTLRPSLNIVFLPCRIQQKLL